jgi:hypothetical protein
VTFQPVTLLARSRIENLDNPEGGESDQLATGANGYIVYPQLAGNRQDDLLGRDVPDLEVAGPGRRHNH